VSTEPKVIWATDQPLTNRDEVMDLYWAELKCQTIWVNEVLGIFKKLGGLNGNGGLYQLRIARSLSNTWEVISVENANSVEVVIVPKAIPHKPAGRKSKTIHI